jgi:hypothetical protein
LPAAIHTLSWKNTVCLLLQLLIRGLILQNKWPAAAIILITPPPIHEPARIR